MPMGRWIGPFLIKQGSNKPPEWPLGALHGRANLQYVPLGGDGEGTCGLPQASTGELRAPPLPMGRWFDPFIINPRSNKPPEWPLGALHGWADLQNVPWGEGGLGRGGCPRRARER